MTTDRPPPNGNGHDPEAEEGAFGEFTLEPARRDILDDGEDVTDLSNREIIIRVANIALAAKGIAGKVDDAIEAVDALASKVDAMNALLVEIIRTRAPVE